MNNKSILFLILLLTSQVSLANAIDDMFSLYKKQGVNTIDAKQGKQLWNQTFSNKKTAKPQSCASCHHSNIKQMGKHIKTGKAIKPMALSINSQRYTKVKKIKKWFKRNCKWTIGRECTAQEQADVLQYLIKQ